MSSERGAAMHADPTGTGTRAPQRATARFMFAHPAHVIALGFGSGLSPRAPGTVGTLWAWVSFLLLERWLGDMSWTLLLVGALLLGVWACATCARHLNVADPSAIVWDEIVAFWAVLWLISPSGWFAQLLAFALFRYFDAAKPGPVGWTDRRFKLAPGARIGGWQGVGILLDDLVAAACTLLLMALLQPLWR